MPLNKCPKCGGTTYKQPGVLCYNCRKNDYLRDYNNGRSKDGKCQSCGGVNDRLGKLYCKACADYRSRIQLIRRNERIEAHQCVRCAKPLPDNCTTRECDECRSKTNAYRRSFNRRSSNG